VIALIVVGIGGYSYFQSAWKIGPEANVGGLTGSVLNPLGGRKQGRNVLDLFGSAASVPDPDPYYQQCQKNPLREDKPCPPLAIESIFVLIIMVTFFMSVALLIASCIINMEAPPSLFEKIDFWYHIVGAGLLLLGAILYVASAVMINAIYGEYEEHLNSTNKIAAVHFLFILKLVAAGVCLIQAVLYLFMGLKLKKIMKENSQRQVIAQQAKSLGLRVAPTGGTGGTGGSKQP